MRTMILLSIVLARLVAGNESAATVPCSCDHMDACTGIFGIPILFAKRDMVRAALKARGFKVVSEDDNRAVDVYEKLASEFKTVSAYYDEERQLADLRIEYPLEHLAEMATETPFPGAVLIRKRGDFGRDEDSFKRWTLPDNVDLKLYRNRGEDMVTLAFQAIPAQTRVNDFLERKQRSPSWENARFLGEDGVSEDAAAYATAPGLSVNPLQGKLVFQADAPILMGSTRLVTDFCSSSTDLDTHMSPAESSIDQRYDVSRYRKPVDRVEVEQRSGGMLHVVLRVRDGDGNRYDFEDVAAGMIVHAQTHGDCRLRAVTLSYEPSTTALCLNANIRGGSPREIVTALVQASGITVDHADLIHADGKLTFSGAMNPHWLLNIVGDFADVYVDSIDATHFSLRQPSAQH
jgi:hypothetical protein